MSGVVPHIVAQAFGGFAISVAGHELPLPKEITGDDVSLRPAVRAFFAFLAEERGVRSREEVGAAFWPKSSEQQRDSGITTLLAVSRRAFGEQALGYRLFSSTRSDITINPEIPLTYDLWAVRGLMDTLQKEATATSDLPVLVRRLLELTQRPYLDGLEKFAWILDSRDRLAKEIASAVAHARARLEALGRAGEVDSILSEFPPDSQNGEKAGVPSRVVRNPARSKHRKTGQSFGGSGAQAFGEGSRVGSRPAYSTIRLFAQGSYGRPGARLFDVRAAMPDSRGYEVLAVSPIDAAITAACRVLRARPAQTVSLWVRDQETGQASRVNLRACLKPVDITPWDDSDSMHNLGAI